VSTPYQPFESRDTVLAYQRGNELRSRLLGDATRRMLERARLRAGSRVLDVGTGPGITAVLAAEKVRPGGSVMAIDASDEMIVQATARVRESGLDHIEIRRMDGSALELVDQSFDAIIGRNSMQFLREWPNPLRGFLRVLRPGGWLSFLVWDIRELNRYFSLPATVAIELGLLRVPMDALRVAYGLSHAPLETQLQDAGFQDVRIEQVRGEVLTNDRELLLAYCRDSPGYQLIIGELNDEEKARYDTGVADGLELFRDGAGYRIETMSRVASGRRSA